MQSQKVGKPSIDSLSIFIPLQLITIVDETVKIALNAPQILKAEIDLSTETVLREEIVNNPRKFPTVEKPVFHIQGQPVISMYYKAASATFQGKPTKGVSLSLNAKMLGEDYFDGITLDNIDRLYEIIVSQKIIWLEKSSLLQGLCTDVDIKQDYTHSAESYRNKYMPYAYDNKKEYIKDHHKTGFQCMTRETATKRHYYIKLYDKLAMITGQAIKKIDDKRKAILFYTHFIKGTPNLPKTRVEMTMKNTMALKACGVLAKHQTASLQNILDSLLEEERGENALATAWNMYFSIHYPLTAEEMTEIKGIEPSAGIQRKINDHITQIAFPYGHDLETTQKVLTLWVNKAHHAWIKNYLRANFEKRSRIFDEKFKRFEGTITDAEIHAALNQITIHEAIEQSE